MTCGLNRCLCPVRVLPLRCTTAACGPVTDYRQVMKRVIKIPETCLVKAKDEVELAHILKTSIEGLDKHLQTTASGSNHRLAVVTHLYQVQDPQFTLALVNDKDKVERSIVSINDPQVLVVLLLLLAILSESEPWW